MPELPDVTQTFDANAAPFLAAVDAMITALDGLMAKTGDVRTAMVEMAAVADAAAGSIVAAMDSAANAVGNVGTAAAAAAAMTVAAMSRATSSMSDLRTAAAGAAAAEAAAAAGGAGLAASEDAVAAAADRAKEALGGIQMRAFFPFTVPSSAAAKYWDTATVGWMRVTEEELAAASAAKVATSSMQDAGNAAAGAAQRTYGWWGLTGNAIHWIVMGTLEIASTAIPALVAFGAAIVAMTPAFTFIKDQMTNLVTASGSLTGAIRNSASPLNSLAAGLGKVQQAATPDAFIIFGSAISIVTSHMGVFSGVAAQAAGVLATFASKLATEFSGPMGQQLAGFFSNAIKYMVQWGQFLGNIGHTFINVVNSMWGVGQLLLDVLNLISRALLVISGNPVGAFFIGLAAAMSAAYRYGQLLVNVFNWLGGTALVNAIKWAVGYTTALVEIASEEGVVAALSVAMGDAMDAALGPIGIAIMAITTALGIWYLATRHTADATQQLIARVESAAPTVTNLSAGIATLSNALVKTDAAAAHLGPTMNGVVSRLAGPGLAGAALQANQDIQALNAALTTQEGKLAHLEIALLQSGNSTGLLRSNMLALSIATDLQDSKLQALNQAWDQYFTMLSGGMSSVAAFATSIQNIGQVAGTTAQNLGTATGTMNLSVGQFSAQLASGAVKGAAAWTNFTQITQSTIPQMIDWFRTAYTAGAVSAQNFSKSVLDMIAPLMQFATHGGPAAQAILVGLAQAAGLGITSFPQLANAIKTNNASLGNLNTQATNATIALSQMNQVAKNLSNTLSVQEANAIANAALKASGFTTDVNNMLRAEQTHSTVGGLTWQQWAARAAAAQQAVQADAARSVAAIQRIQAAENALHNKTITIDVVTNYVTHGSASGYAAAITPGTGGQGKVHPASGGYITGPGSRTSDSIPAMLSNGEFVIRAAAVEHYGRGLMEALNSKRLAAGGPAIVGPHNTPTWSSPGGWGLGAGPALHYHSNITLQVDGKALGSVLRTEILTYNRRNPSSNVSLRIR